MKNKSKKINHTIKSPLCGRTMLEMLGVLAVVGMLSMGALAAYNAAINKHRANTVLGDVSLAFTEINTKEEVPDGLQNIGFTPDSGLTIYAFRDISGNDFVRVEGVMQKVCDNLLSYKNSGSIGLIYDTTGAEITTCANNQTMIFGLANGAANAPQEAPTPCNNASDCSSNQYCSGGICLACPDLPSCGENACCTLSGPVNQCNKPTAVMGTLNKEYSVLNADGCIETRTDGCSLTTYPTVTQTCNGTCDNSGNCTPCPAGTHIADGVCVECTTDADCTGNENGTICNQTSKTCTKCSSGFWTGSSCLECNFQDSYGVTTTKSECLSCPNRYFATESSRCWHCSNAGWNEVSNNESCHNCDDSGTRRFLGTDNSCYSCYITSAPNATAAECNSCSNRVIASGEAQGSCALKCDGDSWMTSSGDCMACSYPDSSGYTSSRGQCLGCSNRYFATTSGRCWSCSNTGWNETSDTGACHNCDDSGSPRFLGTDSICYACNVTQDVASTSAECATCGDSRSYDTASGVCVLKCSGANQWKEKGGSCIDCSFLDTYGYTAWRSQCLGCSNRYYATQSSRCWNCSNADWNEISDAGACHNCDASGTPRFLSTSGICYSCNVGVSVESTAAECATCSNRTYQAGECVKN